MDDSFAWNHIVSGVLIWILILSMYVFTYFDFHLFSYVKPVAAFDLKKRIPRKGRFETLVIAIFSKPDQHFDMNKNEFVIQLLHRTRRMAELKFPFIAARIRSDYLRNDYYRVFSLVRDTKKMEFITRLRATHQSSTHKIFFEGLEVLDYETYYRVFYPVKEWIKGGVEISKTNTLLIKPQTLKYWSNHTFNMSFERTLVYDFGPELKPFKDNKSISGEQINGVVIPSRLAWYERTIFSALLFCLTFVFNVLILIFDFANISKEDANHRLLLTVLLSGLFSLLMTQGFAFIYYEYIKPKYEFSDSPVARSERRKTDEINIWLIFRTSYLIFVVMVGFLATILGQMAPFVVEEDEWIVDKYGVEIFNYHPLDEFILFYILFIISLPLSLTLWKFLFCSVRHLFRWLTFKPKELQMNRSEANSPDVVEDNASSPKEKFSGKAKKGKDSNV